MMLPLSFVQPPQVPDPRRNSLVSAISEPAKSGWRGAKGIFEMAQVKADLQQSRLVTKSYRDNLTELSELRNNFSSISLERSQKLERIVDRALGDIQRSEDLLKKYSLDGTKTLRKVTKVLRWKLADKRTFARYQNRVERNDSTVRDEIHEFKFQTLNNQVQRIISSRVQWGRQGISEAPKGPKRCFRHGQLPSLQQLQDGQFTGPLTGQRVVSQGQESLSSCSTTSIDSAPGPSSVSPPRAYISPTGTITDHGFFRRHNSSTVTYPAIPQRIRSSIPLKDALIKVMPSSLRNGPGKIVQKGKGKAVETELPSIGMKTPLTVPGQYDGESTSEQLQTENKMHLPDGNNIDTNDSITTHTHATYSDPPLWAGPYITVRKSEHESRQHRLPLTDSIPDIATASNLANLNNGLDLPITLGQHDDDGGPDTSTEIASSSGMEGEEYDDGSRTMASKPVGRDGDGGSF